MEELLQDKNAVTLAKMLKYDWVFSTPWEKLIISLMFAYTIYNLWRLVF